MLARLDRVRAGLGVGRTVALLSLVAGTLLALVAVAARAYQPVSGDEPGREPSAEFFDYFFTGAALLWLLGVALLVYLFVGQAREDPRKLHVRLGLRGALFVVGIILVLVYGRDILARFRDKVGGAQQAATARMAKAGTAETDETEARRSPEFVWPLALGAGLAGLVVAGVLLGTRTPRRPARASLGAALADALDNTLDDLRREGDPRRAVIAAYARMERLLGAHGVVRQPADAPLEYLERVLLELDVGERPVAALTALFEEAKFSQHDVRPASRDQAIAALEDVRDALRGAG